MPFLHVESSAALLDQLALSPTHSSDPQHYYDVFRHDDGKAFFYREFGSDGREWNLRSSEVRIGTDTYKVREATRLTIRSGNAREVLMSLIATSEIRLTQHRRKKLHDYLVELVPILGKAKHKDFKLAIVDETVPRKPRSISKLVTYLNRLAPLLQRSQLIHCQEMFLGPLFEDEIELLRNHIRGTNGKDLTPLALLVFELGHAKRGHRLYPQSETRPHADLDTSIVASDILGDL